MIRTRQNENVKASTKKLWKITESENENRCQSARSSLRESKNKLDTSRTRSVSPPSKPRFLPIDLPLKKFYKIYSKIVLQLETVKSLAETKLNETENLVDLRRQLQRADEFAIRFSRNNLYEMKRIMNEIKKVVVPYPFENLTPGDGKALCRKLILGYQAASQSLQIYINYAKNPSNLEVPEKINELILIIADLFLFCENLSLPPDEVSIQNNAVKICNELIALFSSKVPVGEILDIKEADLKKKKSKPAIEELMKAKKFSMYQAKLTKPNVKEFVRKKSSLSGLLESRSKKMKKKDQKKARMAHEIYTQKMTTRLAGGGAVGGGNKFVKFEGGGTEKEENAPAKKPSVKRSNYAAASEVKSQDDDVETMVQTIGNDEAMSSRTGRTPQETEGDSDMSSNFNKSSFRELLLEAIEELQCSDKKEQKATLIKLLNSIQTCSTPRVKVYHFKSKDLEEEEEKKKNGQLEVEELEGEQNSLPNDGLNEAHKLKNTDEVLSQERRLNMIFKPIKERKRQEKESDLVPRGKIKLILSEDVMSDVVKYKKAFAEFRRNNIMYKKTLANKPWELVGRISDVVIYDVIKEISMDFENDAILKRLYLNELLEVN